MDPMTQADRVYRQDGTAVATPSAPSLVSTLLPPQPPARPAPVLQVQWAQHQDEVRAAQRLRHAVFAGEMGARLPAPLPGHDIDHYDEYCEHLIVRDAATTQVVGTYRLLTPAQAKRAGGLYSDSEFDLGALDPWRERMVELGRSCVHADYRSGAVILALWGALAEFMQRNRLDAMVGCASMPMQHPGLVYGEGATRIWMQLQDKYLAEPGLRVQAKVPLPLRPTAMDARVAVEVPPLIHGYLRMGAKVLGAPAWDPDFQTADLPIMLRIDDLPARYRRMLGLG